VVIAQQQQTLERDNARQILTLSTTAGDVSVRTNILLEDGARVALEVLRNSSNRVTAQIVTIDDVQLKQALAQSTRETCTRHQTSHWISWRKPHPQPAQPCWRQAKPGRLADLSQSQPCNRYQNMC
jgi:hypothetical protein